MTNANVTKIAQHEVANAAAELVRGLTAGETERGAATEAMRVVIASRDTAMILAMRSHREVMVQDSRIADVWIRGILSNAVRGKEFKHLPRLTVKKQKILPGKFMYSVVEKAASDEGGSDEEKAQDAIADALNTLRAVFQNQIALSEENADSAKELLAAMQQVEFTSEAE